MHEALVILLRENYFNREKEEDFFCVSPEELKKFGYLYFAYIHNTLAIILLPFCMIFFFFFFVVSPAEQGSGSSTEMFCKKRDFHFSHIFQNSNTSFRRDKLLYFERRYFYG